MYKHTYYLIIIFLVSSSLVFGINTDSIADIKHQNQDVTPNVVEGYKDFSRSDDSIRVVELRAYGADLRYDVTRIEAKAGEKLTIRFINESDMPHNVVVVPNKGNIQTVGVAALNYSKNDYIPEDQMDKILAYTSLARPGETVEFTFTVPPPGTYPYICTYPGHFTSMRGELISTK